MRFVLSLSCVILFLYMYFSVLLALRLSRFGTRELISVLFVRLFELRLFGFVCFFFLFVSGIGCGLIVAFPGLFSYICFVFDVVSNEHLKRTWLQYTEYNASVHSCL